MSGRRNTGGASFATKIAHPRYQLSQQEVSGCGFPATFEKNRAYSSDKVRKYPFGNKVVQALRHTVFYTKAIDTMTDYSKCVVVWPVRTKITM